MSGIAGEPYEEQLASGLGLEVWGFVNHGWVHPTLNHKHPKP